MGGPASGSMRIDRRTRRLGAEIAQSRDEPARLGARARDDDASAVQRPQLGPGDLARAARHRADHRDRGRADARRLDVGGDRRQRAASTLRWAAVVPDCVTHTGVSGALPPAISAAATAASRADAHEHDERARQRGERTPSRRPSAACRAARARSRS